MRQAEISRRTAETNIRAAVNLDGAGKAAVTTDIGFFDHMLDHLARHSLMDIEVECEGDLHIDPHHTVEDVGISLGQAFAKALDGAHGIVRYGHALVPMDETLAEAALDVSGRPFLHFEADLPKVSVGGFDAELTEEFFRAFAINARVTLHIVLRHGTNVHHIIEGVFKAVARAISAAVARDERVKGAPSTKGTLET